MLSSAGMVLLHRSVQVGKCTGKQPFPYPGESPSYQSRAACAPSAKANRKMVGEAQSDLSAKSMTSVTGLTGPTVSSARIGQAPFSGHQGGFGRSNHWMVKRRVQMSGCEQRIVFRTVAGMGCPYLSKRQLWKKIGDGKCLQARDTNSSQWPSRLEKKTCRS